MTDTATDSTGRKPAGALFVVATPIGNLQDLSPRAATCLRDADLLLAEDTRHTRTLLEACGIARAASSIESLHEHNERERVPALVSRLQAGARIALVTDAGAAATAAGGAALAVMVSVDEDIPAVSQAPSAAANAMIDTSFFMIPPRTPTHLFQRPHDGFPSPSPQTAAGGLSGQAPG